MPPQLALFACLCCIAWLLLNDNGGGTEDFRLAAGFR